MSLRVGGTSVTRSLNDVVLLAARGLLGGIFIFHGWQKADDGVAATAAWFEQLGIPYAEAAAYYAILSELVGGAMLVLGVLTPIAGLALAAQMGGAFWYVHRGWEPQAAEGGWELVAALGVGALVVGLVGPGRLSVDAAVVLPIQRLRAAGRAEERSEAAAPTPTTQTTAVPTTRTTTVAEPQPAGTSRGRSILGDASSDREPVA